MKRKFSALMAWMIAVALLVTTMPFSPALALEASEMEGLHYSVFGGGNYATITDYTGTATELVLPETVGGYPIGAIGARAFEGCRKLVSVELPSTVVDIKEYAFKGCVALQRVSGYEVLKTLGDYAFFDCSKLEEFIIPQGLTVIGEYAFYSCDALTDMVIPEGVTAIETRAFYECINIESMTIPESVTTIGFQAFSNCSSLKSLVIPGDVATIPSYMASACSSLESVILSGNVTTIEAYAFQNCRNLKCIMLPDSVTTMQWDVFNGCNALESVNIPTGITEIPSRTLANCHALQSVVIPEGVTSIGASAFQNCRSLQSITIPASVTSIKENAFSGCESLRKVVIPDTVREIGSSAFSRCVQLNRVIIENGITTISTNMFYGCKTLRNVVIPNSVTTVSEGAFKECSGLKTVYYLGTPAEWEAVEIGEYNYDFLRAERVYPVELIETDMGIYAVYEDGTASLVEYIGSSADVTVPTMVETYPVTSIGDAAFAHHTHVRSVTLPLGITAIEVNAFRGCTNLESVNIPDTVTVIDDGAFFECTSLREIAIPYGVESIGTSAFFGCENLEKANIPNSVTMVGEYAFYLCGALTEMELSENLTEIPSFAFAQTGICSIVVPSGVTKIGAYAFYTCGNLQYVALPAGVTEIGMFAFSGTALQGVYYGGNEEDWEAMSIWHDNECLLNAARIYGGVRIYGDIAYQVYPDGTAAILACDNTKASIAIPAVVDGVRVTHIHTDIFDDCVLLTAIKFDGSEADWQTLTQGNVNIPDNVYILFNAATYKGYPDVSESAWYFDAVEHVSVKGYMSGFGSGKFGPAANLQRQDFVLILARIAGADLDSYVGQNGGLSDVSKSSYYAPAVAWAVDNGIITGYQNGKFGVGDPITREQVCTILYRYSASPAVENVGDMLAAFPDRHRISAYAENAVAWAVQSGVMSGMATGRFAPEANASRAQVATIVMRMDRNGMLI